LIKGGGGVQFWKFQRVLLGTGCEETVDGALLSATKWSGRAPQWNNVGAASSMLKAKGLTNWLWGEAVVTDVYILNRTPTRSVVGGTPFEYWFGKKTAVQHHCTFECIAYVKSTRPNLSKLDDKGRKMIFIGYEQGTKAYRFYVLVLKSAHVSSDVVFDVAGQWDWRESLSVNE
jgi:hypothetical protein